jgi:hypothetical protein
VSFGTPRFSKPLIRSGMTRFQDGTESLKPSRSRSRFGFASARARGAPSGSRARSKSRQAWWRKAMLAIGGRIRRGRRRRASIGAAWSRPSIFALTVQRQRLKTGYGSAKYEHAIPLQLGLIRARTEFMHPTGTGSESSAWDQARIAALEPVRRARRSLRRSRALRRQAQRDVSGHGLLRPLCRSDELDVRAR